MIETAAAMIAEMFPLNGPVGAPARRFNELMAARYDNIINFLKLHYCLSRRREAFWRDNGDPASIPDRLKQLLEERSEEHTSELQSLMRISYAVFCLKKKKTQQEETQANRKKTNKSRYIHQ